MNLLVVEKEVPAWKIPKIVRALPIVFFFYLKRFQYDLGLKVVAKSLESIAYPASSTGLIPKFQNSTRMLS